MLQNERYRRRRKRLAEALVEHPLTRASDGPPAVVLLSHPVYPRNSDVDHPYRADSDLAYLTGFEEPEAALVLLPGRAQGETVLFLRPRDPEREVWTGRRLGPDAAVDVLGVDEAYPISELDTVLPTLLRGRSALWSYVGRDAAVDQRLFQAVGTARARSRRQGVWPTAFCDLSLALWPMRQIKDDDEIALLERAVTATAAGHRRAMAIAKPGVTEADLEAVLTYEFRRNGAARHGYDPIVAAGENACILHYVENKDPLQANELVLIDAGAEVGLYTADVTRTFPVGRFTPAQRRLYDIVLRANEACIQATKPGVSMRALDDIARLVLAEGLTDVGLLKGDPKELATKRPFDGMSDGHPGKAPLDRFYMHSTGHWLGSDVHDVGAYHDGTTPLPLLPGAVLTIEPGLYIPRSADDVPAEYRGIGIRIEDDVLVTSDGVRNLTSGIPKQAEELERLVGTEDL